MLLAPPLAVIAKKNSSEWQELNALYPKSLRIYEAKTPIRCLSSSTEVGIRTVRCLRSLSLWRLCLHLRLR